MRKKKQGKKKKTPTQSFSEEDCRMAAVKSCHKSQVKVSALYDLSAYIKLLKIK